MYDKMEPRRTSELSFTDALSQMRVDVHLQPIVDLRRRETFAVEALLRTVGPASLPPESAVQRAIDEGYLGRLGRRIRELAVQRAPGVPLFVNVHPEELCERWLVRPDDPIYRHDADVYVEITESVPFSHYDLVAATLAEMRNRGCIHLVVDDLGAGYSNLMRVIDLEPAVVKLDRSLVSGIHRNTRQRILVESLVAMCSRLGARVVAEGIEEVEELVACAQAGVAYGQGYLLARPAPQIPPIQWPFVVGEEPFDTVSATMAIEEIAGFYDESVDSNAQSFDLAIDDFDLDIDEEDDDLALVA